MTIVRPRSTWGARPPRHVTSLLAPEGITLHWEGPPLGGYTADEVPGLLRGIQRYHQDAQGWADIAYNFVVDRFGHVWEGRGWGVRSAANGTSAANASWLAACVLCGDGDPFTAEAQAGIRQLVAEHVARGGRPAVLVHRDWVATACPGDEITAWARSGAPLDPASFAPASIPEPTPDGEDPDMAATMRQYRTPDGRIWAVHGITRKHIPSLSLRDLLVARGLLAAEVVECGNNWDLDFLEDITPEG